MPNLNTIFFLLLLTLLVGSSIAVRKSYVVYLGSHQHGRDDIIDHQGITDNHHDIVTSVLGSKDKAIGAVFLSYTKSINGFAVNLEEEEAEELRKHPSVISVFENKGRKTRSTYTNYQIGLEDFNNSLPQDSLWKKTKFGEDTIIGVIDSGVNSELPHFNDKGYGPVPSRWKGACENDTLPVEKGGVRCNRKLIGAKSFFKAVMNHAYEMMNRPDQKGLRDQWQENISRCILTPTDQEDHGTLCLLLAGGSPVAGLRIDDATPPRVSQGSAPAARLASYKVILVASMPDTLQCFDADILAAFDAAIHDGVDVISVSLGSDDKAEPERDLDDSVAIGSFHALLKGIPTVACQGNSLLKVDDYKIATNSIPWVLSVGASHTDLAFQANVTLSDGHSFRGGSLYRDPPLPEGKFYQLVNMSDLPEGKDFRPWMVQEKIVWIDNDVQTPFETKQDYAKQFKKVGAVGFISGQKMKEIIPTWNTFDLPNVELRLGDYQRVLNGPQMKSGKWKASFTKATMELGSDPYVLFFSTPGPNKNNPAILKPDIVAPGIVTNMHGNLDTGTSFSTPITAGVVALLKSLHPDWSPAAIKSAIMTTATIVTKRLVHPYCPNYVVPPSSLDPATPFDYGAGQINPNAAARPGLVYDINIEDYLNLLCAQGFNSQLIAKFALRDYRCPRKEELPRDIDLNYSAIVIPNYSKPVTVTRKVRNVGTPGTYKVKVDMPPSVHVGVWPTVLQFSKVGEEKVFQVTISDTYGDLEIAHGSMTWEDGVHQVRSPIVVYTSSHVFHGPMKFSPLFPDEEDENTSSYGNNFLN